VDDSASRPQDQDADQRPDPAAFFPSGTTPGHFLQEFMSDRYRFYRRIFDTPFSVEGWAPH
jgi:hypothetical protein